MGSKTISSSKPKESTIPSTSLRKQYKDMREQPGERQLNRGEKLEILNINLFSYMKTDKIRWPCISGLLSKENEPHNLILKMPLSSNIYNLIPLVYNFYYCWYHLKICPPKWRNASDYWGLYTTAILICWQFGSCG